MRAPSRARVLGTICLLVIVGSALASGACTGGATPTTVSAPSPSPTAAASLVDPAPTRTWQGVPADLLDIVRATGRVTVDEPPDMEPCPVPPSTPGSTREALVPGWVGLAASGAVLHYVSYRGLPESRSSTMSSVMVPTALELAATVWHDGLRYYQAPGLEGLTRLLPATEFTAIRRTATPQTWRTLVLVYATTDAIITDASGRTRRITVTADPAAIAATIAVVRDFETSVDKLSAGRVAIAPDIVLPDHPLAELSPRDWGWWPSSTGATVAADLDRYAPEGRYDSIFVLWAAGGSGSQLVPLGDVSGLTPAPSAATNLAGYSTIAIPAGDDSAVAQLRAELFVHEFMHQLADFSRMAGYDAPNIDAAGGDGFASDEAGAWHAWQVAFLTGVGLGHDPAWAVCR